jgi:hypothetical protein
MKNMKPVLRVLAFAALAACAFRLADARQIFPQGTGPGLDLVSKETVTAREQRLRPSNAAREAELKKMFGEAGCTDIQEQTIKEKDPPNAICTLTGTTGSVIIVGGHMDFVAAGTGAVDDWSGAALLPSLYEALKGAPRKHTFLFIGFTEEEAGLVGSTFYVRHSSKEQLANIKAMVNLECLGTTPTKVWPHDKDATLLDPLIETARHLYLPLEGITAEKVGDDDTHPFRDKKVPTITIHSLTDETFPILHSPKDNMSAIHFDYLYDSYRLTAAYLNYLDKVLN